MPRSDAQVQKRKAVLGVLVDALRVSAMSAPEITAAFQISKSTTYAWLKLLRTQRKIKREATRERTLGRGPQAVTYRAK